MYAPEHAVTSAPVPMRQSRLAVWTRIGADGSRAEVATIEEGPGVVRFDVRVSPRASRAAIQGEHDGAIKIALTAPPVDGEANQALIAFVAKALGVAKRDVVIVRGEASRSKRLEVRGVDRPGVGACRSCRSDSRLSPPRSVGRFSVAC